MSSLPGPYDSTQAGSRIDAASGWIALGLVGLLMIMLARVVQLQAWPSAALTEFRGGRESVVPEPGRRGDILDRRGRVLAASTFGQRVFVDPARMHLPPDADIITLADALGVEPDKIGPRILDAMKNNQVRAAMIAAAEVGPVPPDDIQATKPLPLIRFVRVSEVLPDHRVEIVRKLKLPGVHMETRAVRETTGDDLVASLLGKVGSCETGMMGAERVLDARVQPKAGRIEYVRDSAMRPLWVEAGGYQPPQRGEDVRLSIDLNLQRIATEELRRGIEDAHAEGGRLVMMDPRTGEILAMVDLYRKVSDAVDYDWKAIIPKDKVPGTPRYVTIRADAARETHAALGRNRCVEDVYEPGSTFKPFMWSAATELGMADPTDTINTEGGIWKTPYGRQVRDVVKKPVQTWAEVLINSSNIGMVKITSLMSGKQMRDAVVKFGFGRSTGTGLGGESPGIVTAPKDWKNFTQTSVAMGHEVAVTPVQMARGFCVFARLGDQAGTLPGVRLTAAAQGPAPDVQVTKRVLPTAIADLARNTMRGVTANLDRKLSLRHPPEIGWRYELFGKSGTAEIPIGKPPEGKRRPKGSDGYFRSQYNASFIAGGPIEEPRLVLLVVIDDPGPDRVKVREHYGSFVAGPVVRRTMERALAYLGATPSLTPTPPELMPHAAE